MISKAKLLVAALALAVPLVATGCESRDRTTERWATTENTNVQIDWDKVNQAYRDASGPEDFERRVNEIYEGDEIISVSVKDETDKTQLVTGFFDKNTSGTVEDDEKIFTIKREPTGENTAQYQTTGYGPYAYYHSPFMSIASGMLMGAMISSMWAPAYAPAHYVTSAARVGTLHNTRSTYRASNPERFGPRSKSGRRYGGRPTGTSRSTGRPTGGFRRGGGSFGLRATSTSKPRVRLTT
jgi:hypothetical protein